MTDLQFIEARFAPGMAVRGLTTMRAGGVSEGAYASLNLATHVGDAAIAVKENRARLRAALGLQREPVWLDQCHGTRVARLPAEGPGTQPRQTDAAVSRRAGQVLAVLTADCLPVLLASSLDNVIAVAHAGWRGLADGVVENTLAAMSSEPAAIHAWLGPAIGPRSFEVGHEVYSRFTDAYAEASTCFAPGGEGKWFADLVGLARQRLVSCGVRHITSADLCTYARENQFYSHRRDGECGRMASLLWMTT